MKNNKSTTQIFIGAIVIILVSAVFVLFWLSDNESKDDCERNNITEACENTKESINIDECCLSEPESCDDSNQNEDGIVLGININREGYILVLDNNGFLKATPLDSLDETLDGLKSKISYVEMIADSIAPTKVIDGVEDVLRKRGNIKVIYHTKGQNEKS